MDITEYFPLPTLQYKVKQPFMITETLDQFDIKANLDGGGITGQAEALRLAISKALIEVNEELKPRPSRPRASPPASADGRAQEVRPEEGAEEVPVTLQVA